MPLFAAPYWGFSLKGEFPTPAIYFLRENEDLAQEQIQISLAFRTNTYLIKLVLKTLQQIRLKGGKKEESKDVGL